MFRPFVFLCAIAIAQASAAQATAQEAAADHKVLKAAGDSIEFSVPTSWKQKPVRSRIIEHEFALPTKVEDQKDGRLTMMAASGSIDANVQRWSDQFPTKEGKLKLEELKVGELKVQYVDIKGTYNDKARPFGPGVLRENYRMLAAIIPMNNGRSYFVKVYGPKETIDANAEGFRKMIEGLKKK